MEWSTIETMSLGWNSEQEYGTTTICMAPLHFIMHLLKISRDSIASFANRNVNSSCEFGKLLGTVDDIQNKGRTQVQAAIDLCYKAWILKVGLDIKCSCFLWGTFVFDEFCPFESIF